MDLGLRNARLNFRQQERSHLMENMIYNELIRRGYRVDDKGDIYAVYSVHNTWGVDLEDLKSDTTFIR